MSALFPTSIKTFVDKVDYRDTVLAEHINSLQNEVAAVESVLGTGILTSVVGGGAYNSGVTFWDPYSGGLGSRIQNIENGVTGDAHTQYLRKQAQADNVITPTGPSIVALTLNPTTGQSADLLNAAGARISKDGVVFSSGLRAATVDGYETLVNKTISGANNTFSNIPASAVLAGGLGIQAYVDQRPRIISQPEQPSTAGLPVGSVWVDTDGVVDSLEDIKAQLQVIVAAAADFDAFKSAVSSWGVG